MRYVFIAVAALAIAVAWVNTSQHAARIKRQISDHPAQPAALY